MKKFLTAIAAMFLALAIPVTASAFDTSKLPTGPGIVLIDHFADKGFSYFDRSGTGHCNGGAALMMQGAAVARARGGSVLSGEVLNTYIQAMKNAGVPVADRPYVAAILVPVDGMPEADLFFVEKDDAQEVKFCSLVHVTFDFFRSLKTAGA